MPGTRPLSDETFFAIARRLWQTMNQRRRRQFSRTLGLMAIASVAELVTIGSLLPFLALLVAPERAGRMAGVRFFERLAGQGNLLDAAIICLVVASVAGGVIRLALLRATSKLTFGLAHDVGSEIFRRTLLQPYLLFASRNPSEVVAGIDKVNVLANSAFQPVMQGLVAVFLTSTILLALVLVAPLATLGAAGLVIAAYILFSVTVGGRLRGNSATVARTATARMKALREGMGALRDVLMCQAQGEFQARFDKLDIALREAQAQNTFVTSAPRVVVESSAVAILGLSALYFSTVEGGITAALPTLGALGFGAIRILPLVNSSFVGWSMFTSNKRVFLDVLALSQTPVIAQHDAPAVPLPLQEGLTFEAVGLEYPGRGAVLHDIGFHIPYGTWTALVGPTGSGKSSLLDLIAGLVEPSSGSITVGRQVLDASTRSAWQATVAYVPQQIFLSDGPIAENIAFGTARENIDMDRLHAVAERAQLTQFIAGLPHGMETPVGDAGIRLSGGQRQRIAIARALYREARLIILDEATGQLDRGTEQAVIEGLRASIGSTASVLVVTHNPAVAAVCDQVLTMTMGRVTSETSPAAAQAGRNGSGG
ncbi:ABC transporter ATP-binding protein [Sphingomonas sp. NIBR02145]|uniref:ABC transporter ATP-binding protein n=1 Tax=Sphingomonas sp. NIBR02145 TaxID=3014784 RepID=UPI0022B5685A|nr:ABC transporter ATP-binding protein [Sphingomonas sp. NIBR02145]WHU04027.1 ABC transporter ATP-binding protein [Sphingomonas sp. NIBR02145]